MFTRIAGIEMYAGFDHVQRVHGSRGAERFAGGFEVWAFGGLLVISKGM